MQFPKEFVWVSAFACWQQLTCRVREILLYQADLSSEALHYALIGSVGTAAFLQMKAAVRRRLS